MPTYAAYGLVLEADLPLPELVPGVGPAEVSIRLDEVPRRLDGATAAGAVYQVDATRFLLDVAGIARYLVTGGREIRIQPALAADWADVRVFLLGTCLGALLHQRGVLALHASAVSTAAGAVLFCGPSAIGKSTLAAAFLQRGRALIADELSALVFDAAGAVSVVPAVPVTRLWEDAALRLGLDVRTLARTRPALRKYDVIAGDFLARPVGVARIYALSTHDRDVVEIAAIGPEEGVDVITRQIYRRHVLEAAGLEAAHGQRVAAVARSVPIRTVRRPTSPFRLAELADAIEADVGSKQR